MTVLAGFMTMAFSATFQAGIYRVASTGGMATLFARDTMGRMNFPNGMDFDASGNLYNGPLRSEAKSSWLL